MFNFTTHDMTAKAWPQLSLVDISDFLISHWPTVLPHPLLPSTQPSLLHVLPPYFLSLIPTVSTTELVCVLEVVMTFRPCWLSQAYISLCSLWWTDLMKCTWVWGVSGVTPLMDIKEEDVNQAQARPEHRKLWPIHILFYNLVHAISLNRSLLAVHTQQHPK